MSKNFEEEYKDYLNAQAPDLWNRIEAGIDTAAAPKSAGNGLAESDIREQEKEQDEGSIISIEAKKKRSSTLKYIRIWGSIAVGFVALILARNAFIIYVAQPYSRNIDCTSAGTANAMFDDTDDACCDAAADDCEAAAETTDSVDMDESNTLNLAGSSAAINSDEAVGQEEKTRNPVQDTNNKNMVDESDSSDSALGKKQEDSEVTTENEQNAADSVYENITIQINNVLRQTDSATLYEALIQKSDIQEMPVTKTIIIKLADTVQVVPEKGKSYLVNCVKDTNNAADVEIFTVTQITE